MPHTKLFLIAIILVFAIAEKSSASDEQTSEPRKTFTTRFFRYTDERSDVPVLIYRQRLGHHLQRIADSGIEQIFIWKDGTIDWEVAPSARRYDRWYRVTASAEKVEAALQEIAESFAQYPIKDRSRDMSIIYHIGANYSPWVRVHDSRCYASLEMDDGLWLFYLEEFQEVFQSGDNEKVLETTRGCTYVERLVEFYRRELPQAGLSAPRTPVYSDEEILKCAALFVADAEYLLFVEKKILDLLWSTRGVGMKKLDVDFLRDMDIRNVHVEREIKDGKSEFFYTRISERESSEIRARLHAERERQ